MGFSTDFADEAGNVSFGVAVGVAGFDIRADLQQSLAGVLRVVGAEGFAEQLAHGAAVSFGERFGFFGEVGRETDGVGAGGALGGHVGKVLRCVEFHYKGISKARYRAPTSALVQVSKYGLTAMLERSFT